jgi:hypothetical protein
MTKRNTSLKVANCLFLLLLLSAGMAWGQSGTISPASFGMQCGQSIPQGPTECREDMSGTITLPTVPGLLRLWDSEVDWSHLAPTGPVPDFSLLDDYLDAIVADPSHPAVIYTFGYVPCWAAGLMPPCGNHYAPNGTGAPPTDLNAQGSVFFNNFVTALTTHCSANGNCVGKCQLNQTCTNPNLIQYYELWNEPNADGPNSLWTDDESQLWNMVKPAASIIEANVPGAHILTPSVCDNRDPNGCHASPGRDFQAWQEAWLDLEGPYGSPTNISDIYNFHVYLVDEIPENRWTDAVLLMLAARNDATNGWTAAPWWDTETNYNGGTENFACNTTKYSTDDCVGQIARWQLLHDSNSGPGNSTNLSWYKWNGTIGTNQDSDYLNAYKFTKLYLQGGSFPQPCASGNGTTRTCPFTEAGGHSALFVWTTTETIGTMYQVPPGYVDYRDLKGVKTCVLPGALITITVKPIMLETGGTCTH